MKPLIWSYSFLSTYKRCKLQAEARYVTRTYPYKESPEAAFGNRVHKEMENYLRGVTEAKNFAKDLIVYKQFADKANAMGMAIAEHEIGVTRDWKATSFKAQDVWGRGKIDCYVLGETDSAVILDWKTGKVWEDPFELEIQAVLLNAQYPSVRNIAGMYVWLKEMRFGEVYDLGETIPDTKRNIEETMHKVAMEPWSPTKNGLCGWCDYSHCKHYKDTRRNQ